MFKINRSVNNDGGALRGKTAIVTGAAGGIGAALCRRLVAEGASVALVDREGAALRDLATELAGAAGAKNGAAGHAPATGGTAGGGASAGPGERPRAIAIPGDVTSLPSCEAAVRTAVEALGGVDILVNNAGVTHRSRFEETDVDVLRKVMEVNYFGAVHCTRAALGEVLGRRGSIVAVSSVSGFAPLVDRCGYAASKHALHGFFDSLRAEVEARGVHVMLVCPSFTRTGIDRNALGPSAGVAPRPWSTVGRLSSPEEVAAAIVEGLVARRRLVLPSVLAKAAWVISRVAPRIYAGIMAREVAGAGA